MYDVWVPLRRGRFGFIMKTFRVYCSGENFLAEGIYDVESGKIKVLAGSKISDTESASFQEYSSNLALTKHQLIEDKVIIDDAFQVDYEFKKLFHASAIISGYRRSGDQAWKLRDGRTVSTVMKAQDNIKHFLDFYRKYRVENLEEMRKAETAEVKTFQRLFPIERFRHMSIEDYDKRGSKETIAYMIEFGTNEIFKGSLGNNKNKLFYQEKDNTYNCIDYFKNRFPGESVEELFIGYRDSLYKLISGFDKEHYVVTSPKQANTIKGKLLMLYHPGELLHFNSHFGFQKLFKHFGLEAKKMDSIGLNIDMQKFLKEIGIEIDTTETSRKLWAYYDEYLREQKNSENEVVREITVSDPNFGNIFIDDDYINRIIRVLKRKKAIILKGVPGVGKTFVIRDLINQSFANIGDDGIEMIQFHQSYSYEEFIEGLRPQMDGSFKPEMGVFYDIVKRAQDDQDNNYFLVIDEINRGNISGIFGELMMLIENDKRDTYSVKLAYSKEDFTVPGNLYVIGTMNTADRSLTLVDYALRRRFSHFTIKPAFGTSKFNEFLSQKMELTKEQISKLNGTMKQINDFITNQLGEDFQIGHSYFITNDDIEDFDTWLDDIFTFEIMPMIEEYFFDDSQLIWNVESIISENHA